MYVCLSVCLYVCIISGCPNGTRPAEAGNLKQPLMGTSRSDKLFAGDATGTCGECRPLKLMLALILDNCFRSSNCQTHVATSLLLLRYLLITTIDQIIYLQYTVLGAATAERTLSIK
jgi:hypothetical protein